MIKRRGKSKCRLIGRDAGSGVLVRLEKLSCRAAPV